MLSPAGVGCCRGKPPSTATGLQQWPCWSCTAMPVPDRAPLGTLPAQPTQEGVCSQLFFLQLAPVKETHAHTRDTGWRLPCPSHFSCVKATPNFYMCIHLLQPLPSPAPAGVMQAMTPLQLGNPWGNTAVGIPPNRGQGLPLEHRRSERLPPLLLQAPGDARPSSPGGWQQLEGACHPAGSSRTPWVGGSFPEDGELNKGKAWNNPGLPAIYSSMPVCCMEDILKLLQESLSVCLGLLIKKKKSNY